MDSSKRLYILRFFLKTLRCFLVGVKVFYTQINLKPLRIDFEKHRKLIEKTGTYLRNNIMYIIVAVFQEILISKEIIINFS